MTTGERPVDPAVVELHRRLQVVEERVRADENTDPTDDALDHCQALAREHNPWRYGTVVDPRIAKILMGWAD